MAYGTKRQRYVYERTPNLLQNCIVSLYGLMQYKSRYGEYFEQCLRFLIKSQWYTRDKILEIQNRKLRQFINYSYYNIPFYRKYFNANRLKPSDFRTKNDLNKLPIIGKETVRKRWKEFLPNDYNLKKALKGTTSGSTGKPLQLFFSKSYKERELAFRWLHLSCAGLMRGQKYATFAGHPIVPIKQIKPPFWRYNIFEKQLIFSSYHISAETLPFYFKALLKYEPVFIQGYPSALYLVAKYIVDNELYNICPRAVFTGSETLFGYQRDIIEKAFNCKLYNWYGSAEGAANITECEKGNMHIQPLYSVMEVVNRSGEKVKNNEEGIIIGTNLDNWMMPLIRYNVGDVCMTTDEKCICGRSYPLVSKVTGRLDDYVVTPEGKYIGRLSQVFKQKLHVKECQIVQESKELLRIRIVRDYNFTNYDENLIITELDRRLGSNMRYEFVYIDKIPRTNNSKFKYVINNYYDFSDFIVKDDKKKV